MATCNICKYAGTQSYKSPCSECKGFSKYEYKNLQTNADRIRAMSDEELAKNLVGEMCCYCKEYRTEKCHKKCIVSMLEWLKQPAK